MDDIKIVHLKSNAQQLETWIAMVNGEIVGHIYMERERDQKIKFLVPTQISINYFDKLGKLMASAIRS